jgi:hypothetical protein
MSAERPVGMKAALEALLAVDPRDVGCEETWRLIHVYAEIAAEGGDPEKALPGISAHLRACPPCSDDYLGLQNALMTADRATKRGS